MPPSPAGPPDTTPNDATPSTGTTPPGPRTPPDAAPRGAGTPPARRRPVDPTPPRSDAAPPRVDTAPSPSDAAGRRAHPPAPGGTDGQGGRRAGRAAVGAVVASLVLLLAAALAGESAAVPGLGDRAAHPAWSLDLGWGSGTVTVVLGAGYLLGALGVALALVAVRRGATLRPRHVLTGAVVLAAALAVVPPVGSGDHLNYAAYGRIAAAGGDPYVERPTEFRDGTDPVASASQPPWTGTRSVYGPVATGLHVVASLVGQDSLRLTVLAWHLMVVGAFGLTAWLLDRLARRQPDRAGPADDAAGPVTDDGATAARTRVAALWTFNPFVVGPAVLGSHLDVIGVAAIVAALALVHRWPLLAGAAVGVAAGVKLPYALVGVALLWGVRHLRPGAALRATGWGLLGAAVVLVPAHLWAGVHVYDQLERARRYVSLATPWRPLVDSLDPLLGTEQVRGAVSTVSLLVAVALAVVLLRLTGRRAVAGPGPVTVAATRATWVLGAAWLLSAPYALPWYDVLLWAPLALLAPGTAGGGPGSRVALGVDAAVLARSAVLALAYVPGRVVGLSPRVEDLTLGFRADVAPWLVSAVLLWLVVLALRGARRPAVPRPPAPGSARSPR